MRKFILSSLELFSHVAIFLILVFGVVNGIVGGGNAGGLGGAIAGGAVGFLLALVVCVVLFGTIFLLMEIAENTRRTAVALDAMRASRVD